MTLGDASTRTGIVYTVDPVNFSVALLKVRRNTRRQTTGVPWETPPPVRPCVYTETSFTPPFPLVPSRARVPSPSSA